MNPDKVVKFGPGQEFRLDKRVIFVEYESMTGELVKCRFDLSQKTEMIYNDHRILSFDDLTYLYSKDEEILIKKVLYYEQECHMIIGGKLLIPTKIYFENAGYQQVYETNNKLLLRIVSNSAYGISSRDWGDVLADSARYIHMQRSRCSGKTMWLSSATSFADEQPLWNIAHYHDICEQWLKPLPEPYEFISDDLEDCEKGAPNTKLIDSTTLYFQDTTTGEMKPYEGVKNITPIDPNRYFDTDMAIMAMTREERMLEAAERYCRNDVAVTEKLFKEEQIMRFNSCKPTIMKVIFNDPATIVFWSDGSKTIVKCGENDDFDPEKGVAMACMKKLLGTNKTGSNYLDDVKKYIQKWEEDNPEKNIWTKLFGVIGKMTGEDLVNTDAMDIPEETENSETTEGGENNDEA